MKLAPTTMSMPLFTGKDGTKMIAQDSVVPLLKKLQLYSMRPLTGKIINTERHTKGRKLNFQTLSNYARRILSSVVYATNCNQVRKDYNLT